MLEQTSSSLTRSRNNHSLCEFTFKHRGFIASKPHTTHAHAQNDPPSPKSTTLTLKEELFSLKYWHHADNHNRLILSLSQPVSNGHLQPVMKMRNQTFRHNGRGELIRLNWSHFARDSHLDAPIEQVAKVTKVHPSQLECPGQVA